MADKKIITAVHLTMTYPDRQVSVERSIDVPPDSNNTEKQRVIAQLTAQVASDVGHVSPLGFGLDVVDELHRMDRFDVCKDINEALACIMAARTLRLAGNSDMLSLLLSECVQALRRRDIEKLQKQQESKEGARVEH